MSAHDFDSLVRRAEQAESELAAALQREAQQARVLAGLREFAKAQEIRWHENFMRSGRPRDEAKADAFGDVLAELDRLEAAPPLEAQEK